MVVVMFDKGNLGYVSATKSVIADVLGVRPRALRRMLPYHRGDGWVVFEAEYLKCKKPGRMK